MYVPRGRVKIYRRELKWSKMNWQHASQCLGRMACLHMTWHGVLQANVWHSESTQGFKLYWTASIKRPGQRIKKPFCLSVDWVRSSIAYITSEFIFPIHILRVKGAHAGNTLTFYRFWAVTRLSLSVWCVSITCITHGPLIGIGQMLAISEHTRDGAMDAEIAVLALRYYFHQSIVVTEAGSTRW